MEEVNLTPELRFPEFNSPLSSNKMGDLTKINQGLQIAISNRLTEPVEGAYFYITNEFLREGNKKEYYILNPPKSVICNENDVLMTRTGNTGQVVTGVSGAFHNNFFKIKYDNALLDKDYLVYFLRLTKTQNQILRYAGTSTIPDLNHGDFYRLKIELPSITEQQKIASFLTAVDQRIQLLQKKKVKLEEYKKGVMQKLFSQEIRFKDENDFPNWEEKKLGEVCDFFSGGTPSSTNKSYYSGDIPFIGSGEINNYVTEKKVTQEAINSSSAKIVEIGDLLYALYGATSGEVAISKVNGAINQAVLCIRTIEINKLFLYQLLVFKKSSIINKYLQGGQGNLSAKIIRNLKFVIPSSNIEQKKIADFLSTIDEAIAGLAKEIEGTSTFKKGLLQKMFV